MDCIVSCQILSHVSQKFFKHTFSLKEFYKTHKKQKAKQETLVSAKLFFQKRNRAKSFPVSNAWTFDNTKVGESHGLSHWGEERCRKKPWNGCVYFVHFVLIQNDIYMYICIMYIYIHDYMIHIYILEMLWCVPEVLGKEGLSGCTIWY